MRVEKTEFVLRERRFWECADFGVLMYRRWIARIIPYFAIPFVVWSVAAGLVFTAQIEWVAVLIMWWIRPLWARLVLAPAAVLLFDPQAKSPSIFSRVKSGLGGSLAADLTWRRFSPFRSYTLSVSMLEGLRRDDFGKRAKWLVMGNSGYLVGLAALFLLLELCVFFGSGEIFALVDFSGILGSNPSSEGVLFPPGVAAACYAITVLVVEPIYVLVCFSLYLNRRTMAEGWDLQVVFSRQRARSAKTIALFCGLLLGLSSAQSPVSAETTDTADTADTPAFQTEGLQHLNQIVSDRSRTELSDEKYGTVETRGELRFKQGKETGESETVNSVPGTGLAPGSRGAAEVLRALVIAAAVALVVFILFINRGRITAFRNLTRKKPVFDTVDTYRRAPATDWFEKSRSAWAEGKTREAFAHLYKAGLELADRLHGVSVHESATESECLARVRQNVESGNEFRKTFETLTEFRIRSAWAATPVDGEHYERLFGMLKQMENR